jgi:hypothetical protein
MLCTVQAKGETPLHVASTVGLDGAVPLLIKWGAVVNARTVRSYGWWMMLHMLSYNLHVKAPLTHVCLARELFQKRSARATLHDSHDSRHVL